MTDATQAVLQEIEAKRRWQIAYGIPELEDAEGDLVKAAATLLASLREDPCEWASYIPNEATIRADAIKAAALIVAEIVRLDRKEKRG